MRRPFTGAGIREAPAALSPGDIALDVDVNFVGHRLDVISAGDSVVT